MTAKVILNPAAARGEALVYWEKYRTELDRAGVEFELVLTQKAGDAEFLAKEACALGFSPIIAAGGDGTISEVVNGIMTSQTSARPVGPVGIIPLGSSNDLAKTLGIPLDPAGVARIIANGRTRTIDIGIANGRYFVLNAAIGIEAEVSRIQSRISWISGPVRYQVAALMSLIRAKRGTGVITWEGGNYEGPLVLVTIGNASRTGGFYMTPHADIADGLLTFVYAIPRSRLSLLMALRRALRKPGEGNYVELDGIFEVNSPTITVDMEPVTSFHADGEIQSDCTRRLECSVIPSGLLILAGEK